VNSPKVLEGLEKQEQLEDIKEQTIDHNNQSDDFISSNASHLFECYY
jgi:hypothetical protein